MNSTGKQGGSKTEQGTRRPNRRISGALIDAVCERLTKNQHVRRSLPGGGRLHVDRQLPFLCVYRRPIDRDDVGTDQLVKTSASYLIAPGDARHDEQISELVQRTVATLAGEFGAFLILELWSAPDGGQANDPAVPTVRPTFTVHVSDEEDVDRTVEVLEARLAKIKILKQGVTVEVVREGACHPPGLDPLLSEADARALDCTIIGLAVPPVYRKLASDQVFPPVMRALRRSLGLALRKAIFEFSCSKSTRHPAHYHALGRRAVVKAVWEVDRQLAEVSDAFDYLLLLNPVNSNDAYQSFKRRKFERVPTFHYRPLPIDTGLLKRQLYKVPIERIEDPALQHIFQEKQEELELKITMLRDRDTPAFIHESQQLFGAVDDELFDLAKDLLERLPRTATKAKEKAKDGDRVDAEEFAQRARAQIERYRQTFPGFEAAVRVTENVSGLIVSRGKLMINRRLSVPRGRVDALLAHEVGTHLLTYYNGRAQPFRQLYSGLAAYEGLQEGLAVMAEYLVGGLSRDRMRQLAARVVAARHLVDGASFVETFGVLRDTYGFGKRSAYTTTMRIYRGGGLTKDVVYLRGLRSVVRHVREGHKLRPLYVGKFALHHLPMIQELRHREVLKAAPLEPSYLSHKGAAARLAGVREGDGSVLQLVAEEESA